MTEFRAEDCEVWRQYGTDPGWRAKHKPTGIVICSGYSWQEDEPPGMIDGLRRVVERHWEEEARRNEHSAKLGAQIAARNGWTVHCRGGCADCDWQGFLLPDGKPIPRGPVKTNRKEGEQ
jgi:hypothetical protein